jgi:hypothetical protein
MRHTTLTVDELNTYTISYTGPAAAAVGAGAEYVLSLEVDAKSYIPDTLGIQDIYDLYG